MDKRPTILERSINSDDEYSILRNEMPLIFRWWIQEADRKQEIKEKSRLYIAALEGLAALTYAVSVAEFTALVKETDLSGNNMESRLETTFSKLEKTYFLARKKEWRGPQFVDSLIKVLPQLVKQYEYHSTRHSIIQSMASLDFRKHNQSGTTFEQLKENLYSFPDNIQHSNDYASFASFKEDFQEFVSHVFSFWPNYGLGYYDQERKVIIFDRYEEFNSIDVKNERSDILNQLDWSSTFDHAVLDKISNHNIRTVVLANETNQSFLVLSPLVVYVDSPSSEENSTGSSYLFLDPGCSATDGLIWRDLPSLSIENRSHYLTGVSLNFPISLKTRQVENTVELSKLFRTLQQLDIDAVSCFGAVHQGLAQLNFMPDKHDDSRAWHLAIDGVEKHLFYRRGATLTFTALCHETDDNKLVITEKKKAIKLFKSEKKEEYDREFRCFKAERGFLKRYTAERKEKNEDTSTTGVVDYYGQGQVAEKGMAHDGDIFFLREHVENRLSDWCNIAASLKSITISCGTRDIPDKEEANLLKIVVARKLLEVLYIIERATAALEIIYSNTKCEHSGRPLHLIHRDLRPENILNLGEGKVKICDFGAAFFPGNEQYIKFSSGEISDGDILEFDKFALSRHYCAPEVWRQPNLWSGKADVFSMGLILNGLLFGDRQNVQKKVSEALQDNTGINADISKTWGSLLYNQPENTLISEVCSELNDFAGKQNDKLNKVKSFDLENLVSRATAPYNPELDINDKPVDNRRYSMSEFRDQVAGTARIIRYFLATRCFDAISQAEYRGTPAHLQHAFALTAGVFGKFFMSGLGQEHYSLLEMVRCDMCYGCDEYVNSISEITDGKDDYRCISSNMTEVRNELDNLLASEEFLEFGLSNENGIHNNSLSTDAAMEVLGLVKKALGICPGLIDLAPEEERADGVVIHRQFQESIRNLMDASGIGGVRVQEKIPIQTKQNKQKHLPFEDPFEGCANAYFCEKAFLFIFEKALDN
ncbi:MAG: protein kinase [Sedimenticola sp.]